MRTVPDLSVNSTVMLTRRQVVQRLMLGTVSTFVGGFISQQSVMADIVPGTGSIAVRLTDYPVLQSLFGSIRLDFGGSAFYPLLITRTSATTFSTLSTRCAHLGCIVDEYNTQSSRISCHCHGSAYDANGVVINGPARSNLTSYSSTFDGVDAVLVSIPGLAFSVTSISLKTPVTTAARFELKFKSEANAFYRIRYSTNLGGSTQAVSFSLTPTGLANQPSLLASSSLSTVYVDAAGDRGFFTVERIISPYVG